MENEKLLPCPFCGGEARAILVREVGWVYRIFCPKCRMSENLAFDKEKEELEKLIPKFIEEWNTRVYPKEVKKAVERDKPKKPDNVMKKDGLLIGLCKACGTPIDNGHRFCRICGQKLDWSHYA